MTNGFEKQSIKQHILTLILVAAVLVAFLLENGGISTGETGGSCTRDTEWLSSEIILQYNELTLVSVRKLGKQKNAILYCIVQKTFREESVKITEIQRDFLPSY